jgi:hypothetical protein
MVENWKYLEVAISSKVWRVMKLIGILFGEIHTGAS